jgi:hypothetical protein
MRRESFDLWMIVGMAGFVLSMAFVLAITLM